MAYDWPGNVRQLVNELRRAAALASPGDTIEPRDLSPEIGVTPPPRASRRSQVTIELDQSLAEATDELERASIIRALELCHGRREQAAALLGLSRKGLYLKCQRLNIDAAGTATRVENDECLSEVLSIASNTCASSAGPSPRSSASIIRMRALTGERVPAGIGALGHIGCRQRAMCDARGDDDRDAGAACGVDRIGLCHGDGAGAGGGNHQAARAGARGGVDQIAGAC